MMGKVLLIACTNVGRSMIEAIYNSEKLQEIELVGVVDLKPEIAISKANYDSYVDLKEKYKFPIYYCDNVNEKDCINFIKESAPDIVIQSGWSQKFKEEILNIPQYACIGEHPAPLPKGRGAACVNWAIITGEKEWGDTFFKMEMTYDTGLIYSQEYFIIEEYDNVKTVYDKVAIAAVRTIEKKLVDWCNGILDGVVQDDKNATHYPRRRPSDGMLDFSQNAMDIYNQIRGQTRPYPGAYVERNKNGIVKKMYIWDASIKDNGGIAVKCGDEYSIYINRVQFEGQPEMWAVEYKEEVEAFIYEN